MLLFYFHPQPFSWQSSLLNPVDLQRTLRALGRCATLESSHDDMSSLCMPSLNVLLHSLLASVERAGRDGERCCGHAVSIGVRRVCVPAAAGWTLPLFLVWSDLRFAEAEVRPTGAFVGGSDEEFAVVGTLSEDNVAAAGESILYILQVSPIVYSRFAHCRLRICRPLLLDHS